MVEGQVLQSGQLPDPGPEVIEVVPHHLGTEDAVRCRAPVNRVLEPADELPPLLLTPPYDRRQVLGDVPYLRGLEVLAGLARQTGGTQGLEELVGHSSYLGALEQLAEERAPTPL